MSIPAFLSGMSAFDVDVYTTDRDNSARTSLASAIISVQPDWDIDRSGSKGTVAVETRQPVLADGMWIAPYIRITPEVGDVIEQQMGHFRLTTPGAAFDGSTDSDDAIKVLQRATGADIVDDLAAARLPETFATPKNGLVMQDVRNLIRLATMGVLGTNMVSNSSFEQEGAGWSAPGFYNGLTGTTHWQPFAGHEAVTGTNVWRVELPPNPPVSGYVWLEQNCPVPPGTRYMFATAVAFRERAEHTMTIMMEFRNAAGAYIASHRSPVEESPAGVYARPMIVAPVPTGAATVYLYLWTEVAQAITTSSTSWWDDVRLGTCTSMPIPDHRLALPTSTAVASTRIQTTSGKSYAFDAMNADRLAAIGHHALYTMLDGRLTTSPVRDLASATPKRQYGRDDYRLVGVIETERSATNRHNHFIALKEDTQNAANSLVANAYNDNPDDPWSIYTMALSSADPIMVQDAVSQDALQAIANAARDRASEQEILRISVLPDPTLTVHDVIELTDSPLPNVIGKWLVEAITPGMSAHNPLVEIAARRTRRSGGAY